MSKIKKLIGREGLNSMMKLFAFIPDKTYLKIMYRLRMGKSLNLDNPQTFNEKLQYLKLYDRKPEYTMMVDKYEVKKYVADKIGDEYIIPTLGVWDKFEDIDFDVLPNQFVLKCTHDSGGLVICRDKSKLDKEKAREKIERSLKCNFYWVGREWPYKNVKPCIIAEEYLTFLGSNKLVEYKIFCFNGEPKLILVCKGEGHGAGRTNDFYDLEFKHIPVRVTNPNAKEKCERPEEYNELINLARILAKDTYQVRVDFYVADHKIYFGELTFFHDSGFCRFNPIEWDKRFGNMLKIPVGKVE